jgi:N-acetylmuramic acid 6-phosphate etherase
MTEPTLPPAGPPDRSHLLTEQRNPRSMNLHTLSVEECVHLIQEEDRAILQALESARPALTAFIQAAEERFCPGAHNGGGGRLIYVGAGTSGRLGVLDASEAPPTFQIEPGRIVGIIAGGDAALRRSSEGKEDEPEGAHAALLALGLTEFDCVIGIAAGGTTPYVLGALEFARRAPIAMRRGGAESGGVRQLRPGVPAAPLTCLLVCAPMDRPPFVDHLVVIPTGPEVLTGSTRMKAGTATKMALNTISTTLMVRAGRVYQNLMVDLRATNSKLLDRAARVVGELTGLGRVEAMKLLHCAGGNVKTAIVMHCGQEGRRSRREAEALLERAGGRLGLILNPCENLLTDDSTSGKPVS